MQPPALPMFPSFEQFKDLIRLAVEEDLGEQGDITSRLTIPESAQGVATIVQKAPGVACGLAIIEPVCGAFDERIKVEWLPGFHPEVLEGRYQEGTRQPLARLRGPLPSLLAAERTVLNFLGHLGGIATLTRRYLQRIDGTAAKIYDTRKTTPGMRRLEKYAVRCGGGRNHREGLFDMVLVKDNHLAALGGGTLAQGVATVVERSRREAPERLIEVEVDTLAQFREVLAVKGIDIILLDNMDCPTMRRCVELRDSQGTGGAGGAGGARPSLEASGGVNLETVRDIALTGVERIAIGSLTHSAPALDVGLDLDS